MKIRCVNETMNINVPRLVHCSSPPSVRQWRNLWGRVYNVNIRIVVNRTGYSTLISPGIYRAGFLLVLRILCVIFTHFHFYFNFYSCNIQKYR